MIYRNMVPNGYFPYGAGNVPPYDASKRQIEQSAELFIGEYAPVGHQGSIDDFRNDSDGFKGRL